MNVVTSPQQQLVPTARWLRSTAGPWVMVGLGAVGTVLVAMLGAELTEDGPLASDELPINQWLAGHRTGFFDAIAWTVQYGLGPLLGPALLALVCVVLYVRGERRFALTWPTVTLITWLSTGVTKLVVQRPRPPGALLHALFLESGRDSYPSGHTALATALVVGLAGACWVTGRRIRWVLVIGAVFVVVVGLSRMYAGVHYLGDVLAGPLDVVLATIALVGAVVLIDRRWPRLGLLPPGLTRAD